MNDTRDVGLSLWSDDAAERGRIVKVEKAVMARNREIAAANREAFDRHQVLVLNVVSSPGSGKTELIARTLSHLARAGVGAPRSGAAPRPRPRAGVIVGDLATDRDGLRLRGTGASTVQITTGGVCHLEAAMIEAAAGRLDLRGLDLLVIENVGNLVCPAGFDLGEAARVVLLSVTEGEDKPLKYPTIFKSADVVVFTKIDLAEATGWQAAEARDNLASVAPLARRFELSARTGEGMEAWYAYVADRLADRHAARLIPG